MNDNNKILSFDYGRWTNYENKLFILNLKYFG